MGYAQATPQPTGGSKYVAGSVTRVGYARLTDTVPSQTGRGKFFGNGEESQEGDILACSVGDVETVDSGVAVTPHRHAFLSNRRGKFISKGREAVRKEVQS